MKAINHIAEQLYPKWNGNLYFHLVVDDMMTQADYTKGLTCVSAISVLSPIHLVPERG